jgi:hypothetical protein
VSVIEIQALLALALVARSDHVAALDALAEALALACPQGYDRVFADEGAPMHALLTELAASRDQQLAARGITPRHLAALVRASSRAHAAPSSGRAAAAPPGLAEPLTDREPRHYGAAGRLRKIPPARARSGDAHPTCSFVGSSENRSGRRAGPDSQPAKEA